VLEQQVLGYDEVAKTLDELWPEVGDGVTG
jgi:hypothetical protein